MQASNHSVNLRGPHFRFWPCGGGNPAPETVTARRDRSLSKAAGSGNLNKVKQLLAEGADPASTALSRIGENAVHKAAKYGHILVLELLMKKIDATPELAARKAHIINAENKDGNTPAQGAIMRLHNNVADMLLSQPEATIDHRLFNTAVSSRNVFMAKALLEDGRVAMTSKDRTKCWSALITNAIRKGSRYSDHLYQHYARYDMQIYKFSTAELQSMVYDLAKVSTTDELRHVEQTLDQIKQHESVHATFTGVLLEETLERLKKTVMPQRSNSI